MRYFELSPAYGRDYKSKREIVAALAAGKDFVGDYQIGFALINLEQFPEGFTALVRYNKNRKVTRVTMQDIDLYRRTVLAGSVNAGAADSDGAR